MTILIRHLSIDNIIIIYCQLRARVYNLCVIVFLRTRLVHSDLLKFFIRFNLYERIYFIEKNRVLASGGQRIV